MSSPTSLFTESDIGSDPEEPNDIHSDGILSPTTDRSDQVWASRTAPPIPGLFFPSAVRLPSQLADEVLKNCLDTYFRNGDVNQVMLFGRATAISLGGDGESLSGNGSCDGDHDHDAAGLPPFLMSLLSTLEELLAPPVLPSQTHSLLFPPQSTPVQARQAILNLYLPGEGISAHVDLLQRFGDGILGLSLGSGCVMRFCKDLPEERLDVHDDDSSRDKSARTFQDREYWDLYLPERSVLVLSGEARYHWKHGIEGQLFDLVQGEGRGEAEKPTSIARGTRLSITFRWLLPGADIVGGPS